MKPLRVAWKKRARLYRSGVDHVGSEGILLAWHDRLVVPYYAGPGQDDIAAIHDRSGDVLQTIPTPKPHTHHRSPIGPVITWPDETLVAGICGEQLQVMWIDPDGASHVVTTEQQLKRDTRFLVTPSSDSEVFVSMQSTLASQDGLGWTLDRRLDSMYGTARLAPFEQYEYTSQRIARDGVKWQVPARVVCVADDIAICEQGSGITRQIAGRRITDGVEIWQREGIDAFVLGTIPLPAWSDDRVYVLDRGERRRQSWAREIETANIHGISADQPMRTILSVRATTRARTEQPITAPSLVRCLSTKTGEVQWEAALDGDVVSFYSHATWVAVVVAGTPGFAQIWRHDGTILAKGEVAALEPSDTSWWPPDAARWPCIAHGDAENVYMAQNRSKAQGGSRLYEAALARPEQPIWETPLPVPCVHMPLFRWLRLLNRVPIAFTKDAAFLRWGKQLYGFL